MAGVATVTLPALALIWRPLVLESLDPGFMAATSGKGGLWHLVFLMLVVLCVVSGFVALGTLMSVGLMMLPAIAARHWSNSLAGQVRTAVCSGVRVVRRGIDSVVQSGHSRRPGDRADGRRSVGTQPADRSPGQPVAAGDADGVSMPRRHRPRPSTSRTNAIVL